MKRVGTTVALTMFSALLALAPAFGADWHATVGAQSKDKGRQALAFLPNEIWIHAGDSISWTFNVDEIHTVTFLANGQTRLPFPVGCPGFSASGATFDGSTCVTAPPSVSGQSFSVLFPTSGNYKLVCLVHEDMTGTIHVLDTSVPLPHGQSFYDKQATEQARDLLSVPDDARQDNDHDMAFGHHHEGAANAVTVGIGKVVANAGGHQTVSLMRFVEPELVIHAGQTVEWINHDPITPHTITFGTEPANPIPPSSNVTVDADGALHATITSTSGSVHSGFIMSAPQERLFLPQAPLGMTRFRVTFTTPGVYPYICALHDDLGMKGRIIVLP
jgi:plastocyanin